MVDSVGTPITGDAFIENTIKLHIEYEAKRDENEDKKDVRLATVSAFHLRFLIDDMKTLTKYPWYYPTRSMNKEIYNMYKQKLLENKDTYEAKIEERVRLDQEITSRHTGWVPPLFGTDAVGHIRDSIRRMRQTVENEGRIPG